MSFEELTKEVQDWAEEKGLDDWQKQFEKLTEEVYELHEALIDYKWVKYKAFETDLEEEVMKKLNLTNIKLEAGDVMVTLINTLRPLGIDPTECLEMAWEKISKRRGKTINGTFVKEEDLDE